VNAALHTKQQALAQAQQQLQDSTLAAAACTAELQETQQRLLAEQQAASRGWAAEQAAHASTAFIGGILATTQYQMQDTQQALVASQAALHAAHKSQHKQQQCAATALAAMQQERDTWRVRACQFKEAVAVVRSELAAHRFAAAKETAAHRSTQTVLAALTEQHTVVTASAGRLQAALQDSASSKATLEQLLHAEKQQHQEAAHLLADTQQAAAQ
jgi:hypothetical protein